MPIYPKNLLIPHFWDGPTLRKPANIWARNMGAMDVTCRKINPSISLRTFPPNWYSCTVSCLGTSMQWLLHIIFKLVSFFWRATYMLEVQSVEQQQDTTGRLSILTLIIQLTFENSWTTTGVQHGHRVLFCETCGKQTCLEHVQRLGSWWSRDLNCGGSMVSKTRYATCKTSLTLRFNQGWWTCDF